MLWYVGRILRGTDFKGVGFAMPSLWLEIHDTLMIAVGNIWSPRFLHWYDLHPPSMAFRSNPLRTENHNLILSG